MVVRVIGLDDDNESVGSGLEVMDPIVPEAVNPTSPFLANCIVLYVFYS